VAFSEGKDQGRVNSDDPLALPKKKGQERASSDFYDFFNRATAQFTGIPSSSMKAEYNKNNWLY